MHALGNLNLGNDFRMLRIFDIEDRRAMGRFHMADVSVAVFDDDLAAAGEVGAADQFHVLADAKFR